MDRRIIIDILIIITLVFSILTGCQSDSGKNIPADVVRNPKSATGKGDMRSLPVLSFEKDVHDFGKLISGEVVSYVFRFTNKGGSDLLISSASSSCGCTVPEYSKAPIKPGESGQMTVTFNSEGRSGFQNKSITIVSNTQPRETIIYIKAKVVESEN